MVGPRGHVSPYSIINEHDWHVILRSAALLGAYLKLSILIFGFSLGFDILKLRNNILYFGIWLLTGDIRKFFYSFYHLHVGTVPLGFGI